MIRKADAEAADWQRRARAADAALRGRETEVKATMAASMLVTAQTEAERAAEARRGFLAELALQTVSP